MRNYILIYDLPRKEGSLLVKINRILHKIDAEKIQHSAWESDKLEELKEIADLVEKNGGHAIILEENIVY